MKIKYDPGVDVLNVVFTTEAIEESDEIRPGLVVDYDRKRNIVGIEILDASRHIKNPGTVLVEVAAGQRVSVESALVSA